MHFAEEKYEQPFGAFPGEAQTSRCRACRCGDPRSPVLIITVAARSSPLSRAQVAEVSELFRPVVLDPTWVMSRGDLDKQTSLRFLSKTDFFTREVDELVLSGQARLAIHSAKDLPDPIPLGLRVAAMTEAIDPRDALVLRDRETIATLPSGAIIATSSERREEAVRLLRGDLQFKDVRGTIEERLQTLKNGEADGVVIAEAALIRLKLTHLTRVYLPGPTAEGQGKLALVCLENDEEIISLCQKK